MHKFHKQLLPKINHKIAFAIGQTIIGFLEHYTGKKKKKYPQFKSFSFFVKEVKNFNIKNQSKTIKFNKKSFSDFLTHEKSLTRKKILYEIVLFWKKILYMLPQSIKDHAFDWSLYDLEKHKRKINTLQCYLSSNLSLLVVN